MNVLLEYVAEHEALDQVLPLKCQSHPQNTHTTYY